MPTIRLQVSAKIYDHLMWFLKRFSKDELQVIEETEAFTLSQAELQDNLNKAESGNTEFFDLDQLDDDLEATIRKYED